MPTLGWSRPYLGWSTVELTLTALPTPTQHQDTHTLKVCILHRSPFVPTLPFLPHHLHHPPLQEPETEKKHSIEQMSMFSLSYGRSARSYHLIHPNTTSQPLRIQLISFIDSSNKGKPASRAHPRVPESALRAASRA